jgi:hypothetical protein
MSRAVPLAVCFVALVGGVNCGPRAEGSGDASTSGTVSTGDSATDSDSDSGVVCDSGQTACEGQCVNLLTDMDNCGECSHACEQTGLVGICWESECTPRSFCRTREDGFNTCTEVCQSYGTTCATPRPENPYWHAGGYGLYYGDQSDAQRCLAGAGSNEGVDAGCDDTIDWSRTGGFNNDPAVAVSCLCLQDLAG